MREKLQNLNRWYDKLREPKKFLVFMAIVVPGILLAASGTASIHLAIAGFLWLLLIVVVRTQYRHG